MKIRRGDIILVNLEPTKGSEEGLTRPGVVIQNDIGNKYSPTTIIAPITSSYDRIYPMNVEIKASQSKLEKDSIILLNQIRTISIKDRIIKKLDKISKEKMSEVDEAIRISLGLD